MGCWLSRYPLSSCAMAGRNRCFASFFHEEAGRNITFSFNPTKHRNNLKATSKYKEVKLFYGLWHPFSEELMNHKCLTFLTFWMLSFKQLNSTYRVLHTYRSVSVRGGREEAHSFFFFSLKKESIVPYMTHVCFHV